MSKTLPLTLSAALIWLAGFHHSQAEVVDFNNSELSSRFVVTGTALIEREDAGLNNSGCVAYSTADVDGFATLKDVFVDTAELEGDFSIRQQIFFKTGSRTQFERNRRRAVSIGLTASNSVTHAGAEFLAEGAIYSSLYITDSVTSENTIITELTFTTSKPDVYKMLTNQTIILQTESWYALEAEYTFPAGFSQVMVTIRLFHADESGRTGELIASATSSSTDVQALFGEAAILRGFFGTISADRSNVTLVDNADLLDLDYSAPPPPNEEPWRSELYPLDWVPPEERTVTYADDMMIQDFSYAGYHRGEKAIPDIRGPIYNVLDFGADPEGLEDSTAAIQSAINDASSNGRGVVFLPEGTYKVSPIGTASQVLLIKQSNIVLRGAGMGKTFIWNTATNMRSKNIIRMVGASIAGWNLPAFGSPQVGITEDALGPSKSVTLESVEGFSVGDYVIVDISLGQQWADEHNVPEWGSGNNMKFLRQIGEIDPIANVIHFHIPLRYALKTRDFPRVYKVFPQITESGIEHLSIGNTEHPGSGFRDNDYVIEGTAAYDVHASNVISVENTINCWIRNVGTFSPEGNSPVHHILSNGITISRSLNATIEGCDFLYPQYGGGGGNGYLYAIGTNETLIKNCSARFGRHNFVIRGFVTSGNVFYRCFSEFTGYPGSSRASDTHIHMSQSNLWDNVHLKKDFLESKYRPTDTSSGGFGTVFGVTQTHGVYWNTYGEEYLLGYPYIVRSDQYNFGYVIGTRGSASDVTTVSDDPTRTAPVDFVEGIGDGDLLYPSSLYEDQFERRRLREGFTPFYATPEIEGWKNVNWLGWLWDSTFPWIYHQQLGWLHVFAPTLSNYYLFSSEFGYLYSTPSVYPFLFRMNDSSWLYFYQSSSGAPLYFYNFSTNSWESYP